jgi:AcrR family transcriptional regulator
MIRDKAETKARILAAVGELLAESGFQQLGVNAIARAAGVDKVLIYRYFQDLPTLLQTFAKEGDYWISLKTLVGNESVSQYDLAQRMEVILLRFLADLKQRPITQEILRWELLERNELTQELAKVREQTTTASLEFLQQTYKVPGDRDIAAISAILAAGMVYMVLRSQAGTPFFGIDLTQPEAWQRIEQAAALLIQSAMVEKAE